MGSTGNVLGTTGSGALSGAAAGSVFGPWGTAVGGLLGGGVGLISSLWGGNKQSQAANKAAEAQIKAVNEAQGQINDYYNRGVNAVNQGYGSASQYQQPYYDIGTQNAQTLNQMVNSGAYNMPNSEYQDKGFNFNFETDPGYQFRLGEGQNAIQSSAAAKGSLLSGATLKALQKYGQDFASNEYNTAYNRAQNAYQDTRNFGYNQFTNNYNRQATELGNQYNRQAGLASMGQSAGNNLSSLASNQGNQLANLSSNAGASLADLTTQGGNARAAGIIGQGNANANMANSIGQAGMYASQYLPYILPQQNAYQGNAYQQPVSAINYQPASNVGYA